jgi:TatD DNase family protein
MIITGGSLSESEAAVRMCQELDSGGQKLFCTVGCHPTRASEFKEGGSAYADGLKRLVDANRGRVVAVGECGLDYARLEFCDKETQLEFFEAQLVIAAQVRLPLFLHCRDSGDDFVAVMRRHRANVVGGVVHSFDGPADLAAEIVTLGLSIGINGCSLKTPGNLAVAASIPRGSLMIETDAPWCDIRPTHAGHVHVRTLGAPTVKPERFAEGCAVKARNEPASLIQVLEVLAAARGENEAELAAALLLNTKALFFPDNKQ